MKENKGLSASLPGGLNFGVPGKDGATFAPSLDDEGNLSWSNDKGLQNPETKNIRGPQGPEGPAGEVSDDKIAEAVKEYMDSGQNPTVELDTTLTVAGKAADAKAVGDALANVGQPTDEQVSTAVNAYLTKHPVDGSMSDDARTLLLVILQNAHFDNDQSANLEALATALGEAGLPDSDIESWDLVWDYTDGVAAGESGWTSAVDLWKAFTVDFDSENGQTITDANPDSNNGLFYGGLLCPIPMAERAVMECVVNVSEFGTGDGAYKGKLIMCLSNGTSGGTLHLRNDGLALNNELVYPHDVAVGVDHTLRLEYDSGAGVTIYFNKIKVGTTTSVIADANATRHITSMTKNAVYQSVSGSVCIKSIKYRG